MRPELELIEKIEQYLRGELTGADKAAFEKQIANDPVLQEEVRLQQELMKGVERAYLKTQIRAARKGFTRGRNFTRWGLGGLSILVVVAAIIFFYKSNTRQNSYEGNLLPEFNEKGEKLWADADRNIPAQSFNIDMSTDTVIETKGGIVMPIPAHSFLDENGNPVDGKTELVIKEALDPATILSAGLSTRSGGDLLETGGMFFIDARKDGKALKIDPANGIYTEIPSNGIKEGMRLFTGKRMPDGTIDWIDPKPLERDLMPVDIKTLNFYPPAYLDSLKQWGYDIRNKHFTDSLYYSFATLFGDGDDVKFDTTMAENDYIGPESRPYNEDSTGFILTDSTPKRNTDNYFKSFDMNISMCGINPASIKSIWNDKFQNTILATREFEERLRVIHFMDNQQVFDLYMDNLDKPLYHIDSLANLLIPQSDGSRRPFHEFALRHDGQIKNGFRQFDMLKEYYTNKTRAFTAAITRTQNEYWSRQEQLDNEAVDKKAMNENDSANRVNKNFREELELNVRDAYRQLGYFYNVKRPVGSTIVYRTTVTNTGWYNVDKYVIESTLTRTDLDYTDPGTGKKAIIKYSPVSIQIAAWNEYDRLYVYLLPNKLSSFMRAKGDEGRFSEKLNELIQYELVCIGYKDEQPYYYSAHAIEAKDYTGIQLIATAKDELDRQLNKIGNLTQSPGLINENDFILYDIKDEKRQRHNMALQKLSDKIREVIFPCFFGNK